MNSSPASSAICVMATMSSQLAFQRSGAKLIVRPPSQFALNIPSLKRLGPNSGFIAKDMQREYKLGWSMRGRSLTADESRHRTLPVLRRSRRKIILLFGDVNHYNTNM